MRHTRFAVVLTVAFCIIALATTAAAQEVTAEPASPTPTIVAATGQVYIVRLGDTLFKIAQRFNVTTSQLAEANGITNPALIYEGQSLTIPGVPAAQPTTTSSQPTSAPTAEPPTSGTYTVQVGDTLFKIAVRFNTTTAALINLNGLSNPNIIYVGQTLKVPAAGETGLPPTPVPTTAADPGAPVGYGFDKGIEVFTTGQDLASVATSVDQLGMGWVKQVIYWRDVEPVRGQIDYATLDEIVNRFSSANLKILFTVTTAPTWARSYILENGPSDSLTDYGTFVATLAKRYTGRVQAYEIWNEPNRRSEWSCTESPEKPTFCKARYSDLLAISYANIKAVDPGAVVVSAGLAPTGYNDGVNAIDDRIFLSGLYIAGLKDMADAVGAHPLGWANPPDSACCSAPEGVDTHFDNPSFFFRNTLDDYRKIIVDSGDNSTPIWITKFGWGTSEDTPAPGANDVFVSYTSLEEQAAYITRAYELATELGFVGPMFLSNLNGCQGGSDAESCYYSLISPTGTPRPAFNALAGGLLPPSLMTPTPVELVATNEALPTVEETPLPMDDVTVEPTAEG
ncbi:MAG: LysM peptidoglycan-binding domain-containing protein [Chloroflexi bacterium]|nr:LysM peptidoglycan-binding domain-containing protein [Chloroflexota bacterium]MCC6893504.1 LysM peptidoglycan-binding domain-containing protein [Anaerolineae bacterium]